jgi:hypothetical protein
MVRFFLLLTVLILFPFCHREPLTREEQAKKMIRKLIRSTMDDYEPQRFSALLGDSTTYEETPEGTQKRDSLRLLNEQFFMYIAEKRLAYVGADFKKIPKVYLDSAEYLEGEILKLEKQIDKSKNAFKPRLIRYYMFHDYTVNYYGNIQLRKSVFYIDTSMTTITKVDQ